MMLPRRSGRQVPEDRPRGHRWCAEVAKGGVFLHPNHNWCARSDARGVYDAFGIFGTALPEKIRLFFQAPE